MGNLFVNKRNEEEKNEENSTDMTLGNLSY